jgi:hypothetical protein
MKKSILFLFSFLSIAVLFSSCDKLDTSFDESLLIGSWVSGTVHYKYNSDYTGGTWDTADNVTEAEAQPFTWTLDKSELTQVHILAVGGKVPKSYTVTELTATSLKYHDTFGSYSFTKE